MAGSFQNEIPKARINITLDVETNGSQRKMELPLKLLVLGKFSQDADKSDIASRKKINIEKGNVNAVMKELSPQLNITVPNFIQNNGTDLRVNTTLDSLKDFHPEQLANKIPELKRLVAMRNLLKELKANVVDNKTLRKELESIMKNESSAKEMQEALAKIAYVEGGNTDE